MNNDEVVEVKVPVARPAIGGLGATLGYALFTFNTILPFYGFEMGVTNGLAAIMLFGLIHGASISVAKVLNGCYYEMSMDKAAIKYLIDKAKENGTFPLDGGLKEYEDE